MRWRVCGQIEPRALALSTVSCLRRTAASETCDSVVSKVSKRTLLMHRFNVELCQKCLENW